MPSSYISCILEGFPSEQSNQSGQRKPLLLHIAVTELIQAIASPGCALPDSKQAFAALSFQLCTWCKHCWSTTIRISIIFEFRSFYLCSFWRSSSQLHPFCIFSFILCLFWDNNSRKLLITYMLYVLCSNEVKWKKQNFLWEARRLSKSLKLVMRRCMLHFSQRNWSLRFKNLNQIIFLPTLHC